MAGATGWMVLRLRDGDASGNLVLRRVRDDALVRDLARSLSGGEGDALVVDGRPTRPTDRIDEVGLCQGSTVRRVLAGEGPTDAMAVCGVGSGAMLRLVSGSGLDCGRCLEMSPGIYLLGTSAACDLVLHDCGVEPLHASLEVGATGEVVVSWLHGAGDPAGHRLLAGEVLRIGRTEWCLEAIQRDSVRSRVDPRSDRGPRATMVLNRPPRTRSPVRAERVVLPLAPAAAHATPFAVASVVLPLVISAALVVISGNWAFAMLTALSPLLAATTWWTSRRSARRVSRGERRRFATELDRFSAALDRARASHDAELAQRSVGLAELVRRVQRVSPTLWERRLDHPDAARVLLGGALQPWHAPAVIDGWTDSRCVDPALLARVEAAGDMAFGPVEVDLLRHSVLGIVGDREAACAVARSVLVQLAVHHGPADFALLVVAACTVQWSWTDWLPHAQSIAGSGTSEVEAVLAHARRGSISGSAPGFGGRGSDDRRDASGRVGATDGVPGQLRRLLVVVDDEAAWAARAAPVRALLRGEAGPLIGVVVAASADRLPAMCRVVLDVSANGSGRLTTMHDGSSVGGIVLMGASADTAEGLAADLARFEDPDLALPHAGLPSQVGLVDLLGPAEDGLDALIARRWAASASDPDEVGLRTTLGIGADGPLTVDLVADGPHALVAGTTGAGKSELLRSWVAALAASYSPAMCNLVLLDFKGGSAFDACAALPHTVAVVSDLDGELADRVLQCLAAELRHREQVLRDAGALDLTELHVRGVATGTLAALARLVVVVDEFATLAKEQPRFLESLVGIAQRGRSLGVHLILATQRPAGVVSEQIKANTNIRIALRVQDRSDSLDVIERPDAADLARHLPGRAYVRLGRHDVALVQTAFSGSVGRDGLTSTVEVFEPPPHVAPGPRPWLGGDTGEHRSSSVTGQAQPLGSSEVSTAAGEDHLARIIGAARRVATLQAFPPPRVPWPEPLPDRVGRADLLAARSAAPTIPSSVAFYLLDDPEYQRRVVAGWDPQQGNLLIFGTTGSGATSALVALVAATAARLGPEASHVHIFGDDPALLGLGLLPHLGTVVRGADVEARARLLWFLDNELKRRRDRGQLLLPDTELSPTAPPQVLVVIDALGSLLAELHGTTEFYEEADRLERIFRDGPAYGLYTVATAATVSSVRHSLLASVQQRIVLRTGDPLDARQLGVAPVGGPPGRGREAHRGRLLQVIDPREVGQGLQSLARRWPAPQPDRAAFVAGHLPDVVCESVLEGGEARGPDAPGEGRTDCWMPMGLGGSDLSVRGWWLGPGSAALVAGPRRSGRSNVLVGLARRFGSDRGTATVLCWTPRPSPLRQVVAATHFHGDQPGADLAQLVAQAKDRGRRLLLVDDAEDTADPTGLVSAALAGGWVVVAAGRSDALRGSFGHWSRQLRGSGQGLILRPDVDLDGELLGVRLPRRAESSLRPVGRAYLVADDELALVQCFLLADRRGAG